MDEPNATEINVPTIAPEDDLESKVAALETEKREILEREQNYKTAYLKEAARNKEITTEDDDERLRRIAREELANSRVAEIAREQEAIAQKALKENKELKLAALNKTEPAAALGAHSESVPVLDTTITPEQMAEFKRRGWTDEDIKRYKENLRKKA